MHHCFCSWLTEAPDHWCVLQKEDVEKSKALFAAAVQHYEDAIKLLPEEERNKPIKQQAAGVCNLGCARIWLFPTQIYSMYIL